MNKFQVCAVILSATLLGSAAFAQNAPKSAGSLAEYQELLRKNPPKAIPPAYIDKQIALSSEGSVQSENWEELFGQKNVYNVTRPAIIPFLPDKDKANGTAVIIAPGGAFMSLSIDNEGVGIAKFLNQHGIAAFVLKYRLDKTPTDLNARMAFADKRFAQADPKAAFVAMQSPAEANAAVDGLKAIEYVRKNAASFGIDSHKIGFIGFSAGGMTSTNVATMYDKDSRPDFSGVIYGGISKDNKVKPDAPDLFIAVAADDSLLARTSFTLFDAWHDAGKNAELHVYEGGNHGFGSRPTGHSCDNWLNDFYNWLKVKNFAQ